MGQEMELEKLEKEAKTGNTDAQWRVGYLYLRGNGVVQNYSTALEWFQNAANKNNKEGQYWLGYMYKNGYGVPQNNSKAAELYKLAAEQGNATAQCAIGVCYMYGDGVVHNNADAFYWLNKSAEAGNAAAQFYVAEMYYMAQGCARNFKKAAQFFLSAAEGGINAAYAWLGWIYEEGAGVPLDLYQAEIYYLKAAKGGDKFAIGWQYETGKEVAQNYKTALEYYKTAMQEGNKLARASYFHLWIKKIWFHNYYLNPERKLYEDELVKMLQAGFPAVCIEYNHLYGNRGVIKQLAEEGYVYAQEYLGEKEGLSGWFEQAAANGGILGKLRTNRYSEVLSVNREYRSERVGASYFPKDCLEQAQREINGQIASLAADYLYGRNGKSVDIAKAVEYMEQCSSMKECVYLGKKYYYGEGVPQNYVEAAKWLGRYDVSDGEVQYLLGTIYKNGLGGVPVDKKSAKIHFSNARYYHYWKAFFIW